MDSQKATSTFSVAKVQKNYFFFFISSPFFLGRLQLFFLFTPFAFYGFPLFASEMLPTGYENRRSELLSQEWLASRCVLVSLPEEDAECLFDLAHGADLNAEAGGVEALHVVPGDDDLLEA